MIDGFAEVLCEDLLKLDTEARYCFILWYGRINKVRPFCYAASLFDAISGRVLLREHR